MANPLNLPMVGRTLRNLVSTPATRRYPVEVRPPYPGARGTLEFDVSTCVYCGLCARRCPAAAITCIREERYFAIEQLTCIACGVCVDVCNKDSLRLSVSPRVVSVPADTTPGARRPGHEEWRTPLPEPTEPKAAAEASSTERKAAAEASAAEAPQPPRTAAAVDPSPTET